MVTALAAALVAAVGSGCLVVMDDETPARRAGEVVGDCVVPVPAGVAELGAPVSVELPEGSWWLFGETTLTAPTAAGASTVPTFGALVRNVADACAGALEIPRDEAGAPLPAIALLPEEAAENAAREDGRRVALAPRGGFAWSGRAYVYYDKVVLGPGLFDVEWLGTGLCVAQGPASPCVRQETLLWTGAQPAWAGPGVVADDGLVYLAACFHAAAFVDLCGVARVAPESAADPSAYRFANAFDGWVTDPRGFTVAFENAGAVTLGWNPSLGEATAVSANIWDSTLELRRAPTFAGGWSPPETLFTAVPPEGWFIGGGAEHAALRSADGRTLALTYQTAAAAGPPGLHLVTVALERE
jgi:hypothetical protein